MVLFSCTSVEHCVYFKGIFIESKLDKVNHKHWLVYESVKNYIEYYDCNISFAVGCLLERAVCPVTLGIYLKKKKNI